MNAAAGWTGTNTGYLTAIGASPEIIAAAEATNVALGLDAAGLNILNAAETAQLMAGVDPMLINSLAPGTTSGTAGGIFSGSSLNPITNALTNIGVTNPVLSGALSGAASSAGMSLITGQPITLKSIATGALGGGVAGAIGSAGLLPNPNGSLLQAGINAAATNVGATAVVSAVTGQPITFQNLATAAAVGGVIGAGAEYFMGSSGSSFTDLINQFRNNK